MVKVSNDYELQKNQADTLEIFTSKAGRIHKTLKGIVRTTDFLLTEGKNFIRIYPNRSMKIMKNDVIGIIQEVQFVETKQEIPNILNSLEISDSNLANILEVHESQIQSQPVKKQLTPHKICLQKEFPRVFIRNYKMSTEDHLVVSNTIKKLLEEDKILESNSEWNFPILLVPKPDKTKRLCIDYRKLNERVILESCPPPIVEECLNQLGKGKIFSCLDLDSGYHQVPLDKDSRKYTAFTTPLGKFEYKVLPIGLKNAPAHFQNMMYIILKDFINKYVIVYMDDIIIYSSHVDEHYSHLKKVLKRLADYGLRLNFKKCSFIKNRVKFLTDLQVRVPCVC